MVLAWGRAHRYRHTTETPAYRFELNTFGVSDEATTFHGRGRSYGDVALNEGGRIIRTQHLNRIISADWSKGILKAEAGISLDQILSVAVPKGWFLQVTPGSKFVSLGGAVANDVHGKNHHHVGSFGACVRSIGLRRSDGEDLTLSRQSNSELFDLTISGLGLTGLS